jgi:hypothetical protein
MGYYGRPWKRERQMLMKPGGLKNVKRKRRDLKIQFETPEIAWVALVWIGGSVMFLRHYCSPLML